MKGTTRKRGKIWSYQFTVRNNGKREHIYSKGKKFETKREAEVALAAAIKAHAGAPDGLDLRKRTFEDYATECLDGYEARGDLRPSTLASYRSNLRLHVYPGIGGTRLDEITPVSLNRLFNKLLTEGRRNGAGGGLSARTVSYIAKTTSKILNDAVEDGALIANPVKRARVPKPVDKEMKYWRPEEVRAFLQSVADDRLYALWHLAALSGMRRGELLGLRWADLDLDAGHLYVRQALVMVGYKPEFGKPKTKRSERRIGLDERTLTVLRQWRRNQIEERLAWGEAWTDTGLVFTREDGSLINPDTCKQWFEKRVRDADLRKIRFHDLRHSYAVAALSANVHPKVVSERLGHSSIGVTLDIYSHVLPEMDQDAADTVATALLG